MPRGGRGSEDERRQGSEADGRQRSERPGPGVGYGGGGRGGGCRRRVGPAVTCLSSGRDSSGGVRGGDLSGVTSDRVPAAS